MHALPIARRAAAISISFWMAAAACIFGCLPALAHAAKPDRALCYKNAATSPESDCCHHEDHSAPAHSKGRSPHQSASCCPTEATVTTAHKSQAVTLADVFQSAIVAHSPQAFALSHSPVATHQACASGGRDTLHKAHLLRI